ncbi:MAG: hypothetical protein CO025_08765, partial [Ignavibacteria bacterium CG_4_9_14_0_2_um_filter_37_13]
QQKLLGPSTPIQKLLVNDTFFILFSNYLQMINKNGELINTEKFFYGDTSKKIDGLDILPSDSTNFILVWLENDDNSYRYKCQKYSETLKKMWDTSVTYSQSLHMDNAQITDGRGGFIDVFCFYYPDTPGILAQQVSGNGVLGEVLTTVDKEDISTSKDFHLYQNYPNPFNLSTVISYKLSTIGFVTLKVYDILGNVVTVLVDEEKKVGNYQVVFSANGKSNQQQLSSGIYFIELKINHYKRELIKCVLLK